MPIELDRLVESIDPEHTVLLFGAGSSIPSGIPGAFEIAFQLANKFGFDAQGYSLPEIEKWPRLFEQKVRRDKWMTADHDYAASDCGSALK